MSQSAKDGTGCAWRQTANGGEVEEKGALRSWCFIQYFQLRKNPSSNIAGQSNAVGRQPRQGPDRPRRYHLFAFTHRSTTMTLTLRFALLTLTAALSAQAAAAGPANAVQSAASAASGVAARTEGIAHHVLNAAFAALVVVVVGKLATVAFVCRT